MKDLQKLFKECKEELDCIGIKYGCIESITINTRAKKRWGQCKITLNSQYWENRIFSINISERLLHDDISDNSCKNTIMHEIIHTCEYCFNHGSEWKHIADIVNDCYSFYNIKRCTSSEEKGINEEIEKKESKYILRCTKCGKLFYKDRICNAVRYPEDYTHKLDGGQLERIK